MDGQCICRKITRIFETGQDMFRVDRSASNVAVTVLSCCYVGRYKAARESSAGTAGNVHDKFGRFVASDGDLPGSLPAVS